MNLSIDIKDSLNGEVVAPQSKSYMQRALVAALLNKEETVIFPLPQNRDNQNMLRLIEKLGAKVKFNQKYLSIKGINIFAFKGGQLNCAESALTLRMLLSILSLSGSDFILDGQGSLKTRKLKGTNQFLNQIGIKTTNNNEIVPFSCTGQLKELNGVSLDCSETSQLLTGLLMSLPICKENSQFEVLDLKSRGYINITLDILKRFGVEFENIEYKDFIISGNQKYKKTEIFIEGDWSGPAFFLVGAVLGKGTIKIRGLNINSKQPDRVIINLLKEIGAMIEENEYFVKVTGGNELKAFKFDATHCPDLIPSIFLLATSIKGNSTITGVNRLTNKESNRLYVLIEIFNQIGYEIKLRDNFVEIKGGKRDKKHNNFVFHSYNDHRMAMLISLLPLLINQKVILLDSQAVEKSYINFYQDLITLGGEIS